MPSEKRIPHIGGDSLGGRSKGVPRSQTAKLLWLSTWFPTPAMNGSQVRVQALMRRLARDSELTLVAFRPCDVQVEAEELVALGLCNRAYFVDRDPFAKSRWRLLTGLISRTPRHMYAMWSVEADRLTRELARRDHYDVVVASNLPMAAYTRHTPDSFLVLEEHNFLGRMLADQLAQAQTPFSRWMARRRLSKDLAWERRVFEGFDLVTMVSEQDRQAAIDAGCGTSEIVVVPNGVRPATAPERSIRARPTALIYAGSVTYRPNLDAVGWFTRDIWPRVLAESPGAEFVITGHTDGVDVRALQSIKGVSFSGHVDDVRRLVAGQWLSVVPLRSGGGTRLKILESLALGTPVVSTSKGVEGLDLEPGRHFLLADEPERFAAQVLRLLKDPDLRSTLSAAGRDRVEEKYDWARTSESFSDSIAKHSRRL